MNKYPRPTSDGYAFPDHQHEAMSLELKTYSSGTQSIRIKLQNGQNAMLRRLTDAERSEKITAGIRSVRMAANQAAEKTPMHQTGSYVANAVLILACCRFDGQLSSMDKLLLVTLKDWISLEAAALKLHAD